MSWDMELDRSIFDDITDYSLLGQNFLEPWENFVLDDYIEALKVPDSCEDLIESSSSSSFGDTSAAAFFGEPEVESRMFDDGHEPLRPRKKRETTAHWRRFISPVTSRCKWLELRLTQLKSQERKYAEELAALDYTPDINKDMKRKKRTRVEDNCDLASYMSNHTLFSYYEKADCNVDAGLEDCHEGGDGENLVEFKSNDLWSSLGNYGNDKSWDDAIQKIIALESQLENLKSRHDKVVSENQGRFCSVNQSSMLEPSDGYHHPDSFTGNASSGYDRNAPFSEVIDRPQMDDPRDNINVEDLTQYEAVKEGLYELEKVGNQLAKQMESFGEIKEVFKFQGSESESYENVAHNVNVRSNLKSCSTLKSKIPRHERKRKKISGSKRSRRSG